MIDFPAVFDALPVHQPLGRYFVAVIPAQLLLRVAHSAAAEAHLRGDGYELRGNQRFTQDKRLTQIADFARRSDAAFPNAIILAANTSPDDGPDLEPPGDDGVVDDDASWTVDQDGHGRWRITIPTAKKLAAVVDGQHRLFAFAEPAAAGRLGMELICSVFFDLPKPFQAQLFATINSTQKRVDKSLTYELFGYNVFEEPEATWTPEKLAVFLTRKLNVEADSPLRGRIIVAPKRDAGLSELARRADWRVSTAVVVEGIMRLYSANPRRDANSMRRSSGSGRDVLAAGPTDKSPMRTYYVGVKDLILYTTVKNYLSVCDRLFWTSPDPRSFIIRTVGVQALFDVLRLEIPDVLEGKDISVRMFEARMAPAARLDFATDEYRNASGSGRIAIRRAIIAALRA